MANNGALHSCWPIIKADVYPQIPTDAADRAMNAYMKSNGSGNTKWDSGDSDNYALVQSGFHTTNATVSEYFNE